MCADRRLTGPLAEKKISRWPWIRSERLDLKTQKESSTTYPVDIRLDRISPHMWWKRATGQVVRVKVYNGPLATEEP